MKKILSALLCIAGFEGISQPYLQDYFAASRYDYYTTEKTGQVFVYIPESKKGMEITVDLVYAFKFLARNIPVLPGYAIPVSFSLENFQEGDNEVTVSFYEDEKWIDSRKVNVVVRQGKFNEIKCDLLTGTLVSQDLPFFPVGFYCQWPVFQTLPEEEAVKGFNLMSPYWNIDKKGRKERIKFMDRCAQLGMKVNYNVCNVAAGGMFSDREGALTKAEKLELLKKEVEAVRDHPALLSWYLYDEPEGQGVPPDSLQAAYDLIRQLDPYHPVTIVFMAPHMADKYSTVMDIAMTDPYPVPNGPITEVEDYVEILNRYFRYTKPVWVVPQAFGGNEWWTREPDAREVRAMTYLGLVHSASGVQYFIRKGLNGSPKSQAVWGECGAVAQEVMELLPSLSYGQPAPKAIASRKEIQARAINKNGMITVMVVNTANVPLEFTLQLEDIDLVMTVEVMFEGRKVDMANGKFSDMIDAYGTRLYRVDSRMKPDWLKDIKPGNLAVDPGFENISHAAVPSSCYVTPGKDRGSTFFLDGTVARQGDHSIKLVTPSDGGGAALSFFGLELNPDRSYSCSVWAKAAPAAPSSKPKEMTFILSLGKDEERQFNLTDEWEEYSFTTAGKVVKPSLHLWSMPGIQLQTAGTAWFDLVQVVPDMEMNSRPGEGLDHGLVISLRSNHPGAMITYTLDGTEPMHTSGSYSDPFLIGSSATVKASSWDGDRLEGTISGSYTFHQGIGANVEYGIPYEKYTAGGGTGLVNGILGSENYKDGKWQGFHGQDASLVIDLGTVQNLSEIRLRFLQDISVWIFLPIKIDILLSGDGSSFVPAATITHDMPLDRRGAFIHEFTAKLDNTKARYVKIEAKSIGNCPSWHSGAGQPGWIFLDEAIIK